MKFLVFCDEQLLQDAGARRGLELYQTIITWRKVTADGCQMFCAEYVSYQPPITSPHYYQCRTTRPYVTMIGHREKRVWYHPCSPCSGSPLSVSSAAAAWLFWARWGNQASSTCGG